MKQDATICVFSSAETDIPTDYRESAEALGRGMAQAGLGLLYGGGKRSLMGALADAYRRSEGRHIISVIPTELKHLDIWYEQSDEVVYTEGLRERKVVMQTRSDAFIALPGGLGTLDEISEMQLARQLGDHDKPIIYLNHKGFYDELKVFYQKLFAEKFAGESYRQIIHFATDADGALRYLLTFEAQAGAGKWKELMTDQGTNFLTPSKSPR